MILLIDNYDSFTFNLARYCEELGYEVTIKRHDEITLPQIFALEPSHIIISPGPKDPEHAGISLDVIRTFSGKFPILGVCLGHQCIGHVFGASIVRAKKPMHGRVSQICNTGTGIFKNLEKNINVTRYHSLIIDRATLSQALEVTAETLEGEVMAIAHKTLPLVGVQFHPEALLTQGGHQMLQNFLEGDYR